ncbi:noncompact myelin-associated protein isoform X2 [Ambystoma mexicanum]
MAASTQSMNTTLTPAHITTLSREQLLYQSAGAIVAAIVVGVIIIFTLVLVALKMYNRNLRTEREFGSQNTTAKRKTLSASGKNSVGSQPDPVMSMPVDIHLENR